MGQRSSQRTARRQNAKPPPGDAQAHNGDRTVEQQVRRSPGRVSADVGVPRLVPVRREYREQSRQGNSPAEECRKGETVTCH